MFTSDPFLVYPLLLGGIVLAAALAIGIVGAVMSGGSWEEFSEGFRSAWRSPREMTRLYFAPISPGHWRYTVAAWRRGGWRAAFEEFFGDGADKLARGENPWL
jgi:hypothetical protein